MQLLILGLNHVTAPVELRERFAVAAENHAAAIENLAIYLDQSLDAGSKEGDRSASQVVIVATCNRTEIVAWAVSEESQVDVAGLIKDWMASYFSVLKSDFSAHVYTYRGRDAMAHLAKVAGGLDSLVLGEPQILGQLKSAYSVSKRQNQIGAQLDSAFQKVFSIAKSVRTGTAIGENPVSVAYAAVALGNRIFSDFSQANVLLIGAGETIELVAKHLLEQQVASITIANRTLENAHTLSKRYSAKAILLADIANSLSEFDVVISSTGSQLPIIGKGMVETAMKARKRKPMFMVDIAVPRDIESEVNEIKNVYLYTVDDLHQIIEENQSEREKAAEHALEIIEAGVVEYENELRRKDASQIVASYRKQVELLALMELEKAEEMLVAGRSANEVLALFSRNLTRKIMHGPSTQLKEVALLGDESLLELAEKLLDLKD